MAALPYMQLYIADYLADTMHLSTEEHGAYLLLMFNYWQTGKPIPKGRLAKIARMSNDRWNAVEESLSEFFTDSGTEWRHERIDCDLENVLASLEQKSAAGKASAAKRKALKETKAQRETNVRSTSVEIPLERRGNENATNKDPDKDKDLKPKKHMSGSEKQPNQTPPPVEKKYPDDFEILWREYPKRSGSAGKSGARKAWQARLREGISPETMLDAVSRYRKWCEAEGVVGTKFVRLAQTFLGPGHEFDNPWEINPGGKNYGQNLPTTGESAAVRAVREERERWEREQREPGGMEALGADGRDLREPLDYEEWVQTINGLGDSGGQYER